MENWQDVLEIRAVIDSYGTGIDRRDWEAVATCFTEDVAADYGRNGSWTEREPFVRWLDETHRDVGPTLHRLTNHAIDVAGDRADAVSYFDALLKVEHQGFDLLQVVGTYTDRLVRAADGWRIRARRTENFMWRRSHLKGA